MTCQKIRLINHLFTDELLEPAEDPLRCPIQFFTLTHNVPEVIDQIFDGLQQEDLECVALTSHEAEFHYRRYREQKAKEINRIIFGGQKTFVSERGEAKFRIKCSNPGKAVIIEAAFLVENWRSVIIVKPHKRDLTIIWLKKYRLNYEPTCQETVETEAPEMSVDATRTGYRLGTTSANQNIIALHWKLRCREKSVRLSMDDEQWTEFYPAETHDSVQVISTRTLNVLHELRPSKADLKKERSFVFHVVPGDGWDLARLKSAYVLQHIRATEGDLRDREMRLKCGEEFYGDCDDSPSHWDFSCLRTLDLVAVKRQRHFEVWKFGEQELVASIPFIGECYSSDYVFKVAVDRTNGPLLWLGRYKWKDKKKQELFFTDLKKKRTKFESISSASEEVRNDAQDWISTIHQSHLHPRCKNVYATFLRRVHEIHLSISLV